MNQDEQVKQAGKQSPRFSVEKHDDPVNWAWPEVNEPLRTHDVYSEVTSLLGISQRSWSYYESGSLRQVMFSDGSEGQLQRKLAYYTQKDKGPASLTRFLTTVVKSWGLICDLLRQGPVGLKALWETRVSSIAEAVTAKSILIKACRLNLGQWRGEYEKVIQALDGKNSVSKERQFARLRAREPMLPSITLAGVVAVLDEAAHEEDWDEEDLEGLCALASMYQHGMRPVQIITLPRSEVFISEDADGTTVAVLMFQTAKRGENRRNESLPRTVRPEWAPLFAKQYENAGNHGRNRFFKSITRGRILILARRSCRVRGRILEFSPGELRHTSAQKLADAGHDRDSLRRFMGHAGPHTGAVYYENTAHAGEQLNRAIGASVLYKNLLDAAEIKWISVEELNRIPEEEQVGAVVGGRLIAGIGRCRRSQRRCKFDPVVSCYGCGKFMATLDLGVHEEAYEAIRAQVLEFTQDGGTPDEASLKQLEAPLAKVQQHIILLRTENG